MKADPALPRYQGRVALEKKRIEQYMLSVSMDEQKAWKQTNTTRRFLVGANTELLAWNFTDRKVLYGIEILRGNFSFKSGPMVTVVKTFPDFGVVTHALEVGSDPVHLGGDVFVSLDAVEPFVRGEDGKHCASLLVYSGAGPKGVWKAGTAIGTKEEFNQNN